MMIKLDIAKSYDKLNWKFMEKMLEAYGFYQGWVEWVMGLVTMPFFNILLSGSLTNTFHYFCGIRQGDPVSPFLFILMVGGLSHLIAAQANRGEIRGLKVHDGSTPQTHQQFIHDTTLMGNPLVQEAQSFKNSLDLFTKASCLAINPNKSQVFFVNTAPATQRNILQILGFSKGAFPSKYLGSPWGWGGCRKSLGRNSWIK